MPQNISFRHSIILLLSIYFLNGNLFASIYHTKLFYNDVAYSNNIINKNSNTFNSDGLAYVEALKDENNVLESLTITSPNGGEFWQVGKTPNIIWESQDLVASITLQYSINNGGSWSTIATGVPSTQKSYEWDVPNTTSQQCLVRATSGSAIDYGDAVFEISDDTSSCTIVVLGSSTSLGTGASTPANSWVQLYSSAIFQKNTKLNVINLSASGYTTYQILPTGTVLPSGVPAIDENRNITKALSLSPVAIIINMPSNDTANGYTVNAQLENYNVLNNKCITNSVGLWIATPQPRDAFVGTTKLQTQIDVRNEILAIYTNKAIDFWNGIAATDGTILPGLSDGDGIHLNDSGHDVLFNKALSKNIDATTCITIPLSLIDVEISNNFNLKVYPNPITDYIFLDFQSKLSGNLKATFFDVLGRELILTPPDFNFNVGNNSINMNLNELKAIRGQIVFGLFTFNTNKGLIQKRVKLIIE
ncbi:GDSL-type esterase/lipase family protein [Yeosuana sp.]|uniref:GDSL-type esterase/lipase family protein n=1 Tax=Yeosuana sp. TaxID=2529388 RepID=UPI004054B282